MALVSRPLERRWREGTRRSAPGRMLGRAFFCLLFFARAKKSESPCKAKPVVPANAQAAIHAERRKAKASRPRSLLQGPCSDASAEQGCQRRQSGCSIPGSVNTYPRAHRQAIQRPRLRYRLAVGNRCASCPPYRRTAPRFRFAQKNETPPIGGVRLLTHEASASYSPFLALNSRRRRCSTGSV